MTNKLKYINNLEFLKSKPKFISDDSYMGLSNRKYKDILCNELNITVQYFIDYVRNDTNEKQYYSLLSKRINKFNKYDLDTEDREYIAGFFEKIMEAIGLESSRGILNEWLYGFKF